MGLTDDLRELTLSAGADMFGVADLAPARDAILAQGGESVAQFPRAVAIGIALPDATVDLLPQRTDATVAQQYMAVYVETNRRLDEIATGVAHRLSTTGTDALPVRASRQVDREHRHGLFSHKMAAHLAGLGWIGKSCLLITCHAGPRVRWVTVLTDAPLAPTGQAMDQACGECRRCVDACPAQAFTGRPFHAKEPRDVRFAAGKCASYQAGMAKQLGCPVLCGLCVFVCPHGRGPKSQRSAT